jgi:hypothetical protein
MGIGMIFTGPFNFISFQFDLNSYFMLVGLFLISVQVMLFGVLSFIFSNSFGITKKSYYFIKFERIFNLERGIALSLLLLSTGFLLSFWTLGHWSGKSLQGIESAEALRFTGLAILLFGLGAQILFASFFAVLLQNSSSGK